MSGAAAVRRGAVFGAACLLILAFQIARSLLVPAPALALDEPVRLPVIFAPADCTAAARPGATAYEDKWSLHAGDGGTQRRCVSAPLALGDWPAVLVRYAGNPRDPAVAAGLDLDGDGGIDLPFALGPAARHGWLHAAEVLPDAARGQLARLVIEDRSAQPDGWVVVRDLVSLDGAARGLTGVAPWPRTLAVAMAVLIAAGVLWWPGARHGWPLAAGVAALVSVEFLQMSAFFLKDEYVLMDGYADGLQWRELIAYYDQFAPLLLSAYALAIALVGDWYAPLQVAMLLGHAGVTLLLIRLLARQGFARRLAVGLGLLFATAWAHLDVVPWFIELCFLASTGLTLVALDLTIARVQGHRRALPWAALAAGAAGFVFAGGVVAPWLCMAYLLVFDPRDRSAMAGFGLAGLLTVLLALFATTAMDTVQTVAAVASVADMLGFLLEGMFASALASLLALRNSPALAWAALAAIGVAIWLGAAARPMPWGWRPLAFGLVWMVAGYALQALVRTNTGFGEALAYRYTYFGMTGAAFAVAAWLQPLMGPWPARREALRRGLAGALLAATLAGVAVNVASFLAISETNEREYFDINRQYYALTVAALHWAGNRQAAPPGGLVPKTLYPGNQSATPAEQTQRYRALACHLAGCDPGDDRRAAPAADGAAAWDALLSPQAPDPQG